jgi:hypothetical protein
VDFAERMTPSSLARPEPIAAALESLVPLRESWPASSASD